MTRSFRFRIEDHTQLEESHQPEARDAIYSGIGATLTATIQTRDKRLSVIDDGNGETICKLHTRYRVPVPKSSIGEDNKKKKKKLLMTKIIYKPHPTEDAEMKVWQQAELKAIKAFRDRNTTASHKIVVTDARKTLNAPQQAPV